MRCCLLRRCGSSCAQIRRGIPTRIANFGFGLGALLRFEPPLKLAFDSEPPTRSRGGYGREGPAALSTGVTTDRGNYLRRRRVPRPRRSSASRATMNGMPNAGPSDRLTALTTSPHRFACPLIGAPVWALCGRPASHLEADVEGHGDAMSTAVRLQVERMTVTLGARDHPPRLWTGRDPRRPSIGRARPGPPSRRAGPPSPIKLIFDSAKSQVIDRKHKSASR